MEILNINVLRGPNYWSNRRHFLIVMTLDLQEMEQRPSNTVDGFGQRLQKLIPTLYEHHCSEGHEGGFLERVKDGTWMGHIIEHVALEMQTLAGMDCGFGRSRGAGKEGVYHIVFSYTVDEAGIYAAKAAVRLVEALIAGVDYDLESDMQRLREIREERKLGPSTSSIVTEAENRGIPHIRLNKDSLVQLGHGVNQRRICATTTDLTSSIAVDIAGDKEDTKNILGKAGVPVPMGATVYTKKELLEEVARIGFPCVVKPVDGNHGNGATIGVGSEAEAVAAFHRAKEYSRKIIVEKYVFGSDFRLLVIGHQLVAAALRTPAHVIGDGRSSIRKLINKVNADPRRGFGHENMLTEITVDTTTRQILKREGLTLSSVLPEGKTLYLKATANISTGGTATDVTDSVHPYNYFMAERISHLIGLDICGIDIMAPSISEPINENGGAVLEVNAAPGFRMHLEPTEGPRRNVASPVVDMLFPPGATATIPIIAITGTNGKTTTTRLIAHMMRNAGHRVGCTTSDGIFIQNKLLERGDCTGPKSARFVLSDPTVDIAVLETARGGILREGLGFSKCDIGIVTNVTSDHLGMKGIGSLEQLARVKSVVVENVVEDGYAILNADDDLVYGMRDDVKSKIALFSVDEHNPRIVEHCKAGGIAAIYENGHITINKGGWQIRIESTVNIPLTFSGRAMFMVQNVLPAVLTAFLRNLKLQDIRQSLQTFMPSPAQTPGRMNLFQFKDFEVLLDYAHNPAGMDAIGQFLEKTQGYPKVGIISGTGDRRDEDIIELGTKSAAILDEVIIRRDPELRGRTSQEMVDLLLEGVRRHDPAKKVTIVPDDRTAIISCVQNATRGSFILVFSDDIEAAIRLLTELKEKEMTEGARALK